MAPEPGDELTTITLTSAGSRDDDATTYARTWVIPAESASIFADEMTKRFGEPACEQVTTVAECVALAAQSGTVWSYGDDDA